MRRILVLLSLSLLFATPATPATLAAVEARKAATIPHPTGVGEVVLRVRSTPNGWGGLYPDGGGVTLYGDGRMVFVPAGPKPDESTGTTVQLGENRVQDILRRARDAGLYSKTDYGEALITDQGTTHIELNANGGAVVADVYALFFVDERSGLKPKQLRMRKLLNSFVHRVVMPPAPTHR